MKKATQVIGLIDPNWIEKQIQIENNLLWAKSTHYVPKAEVTVHKMSLTEVAKYVFGSGIHFIKALPKL